MTMDTPCIITGNGVLRQDPRLAALVIAWSSLVPLLDRAAAADRLSVISRQAGGISTLLCIPVMVNGRNV